MRYLGGRILVGCVREALGGIGRAALLGRGDGS